MAFTGDNCSAVSGLNLDDNCLAFSLGTSDTIMLSLGHHPELEQGHVLIHPTQENRYLGLLCFKNGALVRDTFKKAEANNSWEIFSELLQSSPRGNNGYMALHYLSQEILPNVAAGSLRWTVNDSYENHKYINQFPTQQIEIRALVECQFLNRKAFACDFGFNFGKDTKIIATGGSSANKSILQVMADVFNSQVYIKKTPEAACLGAAYRAIYSIYTENAKALGDKYESYHDFVKKNCDQDTKVASPHNDSDEIYIPMLSRYREMVKIMTEK